MPEASLLSLEPGAERPNILVLELLERESRGIGVDVLAPMRLHEVPGLSYFVHVVSLLNHRLKYLLVQKDDFLDFDSEVVLVG